jgi:integrase
LKKIEFEEEIEEYLALKGKKTRESYRPAFRKFLTFYKAKYGKDVGISHFLDRIFAEFKKDQRDQKRIAETELTEFVDDLLKQDLSNNTIRLYFAAVQNFLKYKHVVVSMSFIGNIPPPTEKKTNGKHEWHIEQIKEFVDAATTFRDKALIMCMFQSGLGVNEICNLDYGDVQDELEAGILPICMKLVRQKTNVEFKTFFGRDAVKYLKLYLETRGELKPEDPLFTKQRVRGGEARLNTATIEQAFSEIAKDLDFIKQNGGYNPARPHSLRAAFNSRLINKIDKDLREFWMGHAVGGVSRAYLAMPTDEMRKLYISAEEFLKIERSSREEMDETAKSKDMATMMLEGKVKELEQRVKMHEKIFKQMTAMSFEEFAKWMQDKNRWEWQQQKEEDKKQFESEHA